MSNWVRAIVPVEINGVTFSAKYEVENYIRDKEEDLKQMKKEILRYYFMTEPSKFISEDESVEYHIQNDYDRLFDNDDSFDESFQTVCENLYIARLIYNNWDNFVHKKTGMPVYRENEQMSFDGSYVVHCDDNGFPVNYNGEHLTKDSDFFDISMMAKYPNVKFIDGTTYNDWKNKQVNK